MTKNQIKRKFALLPHLTRVGLLVVALACSNLSGAPKSEISEAIPGTPNVKSDVFFSAGPGLAVFNGNTGWALNIGGLKEVGEDANLFVGADLGLNFWNYSGATPGFGSAYPTGATAIQLLPTAIYRVRFNKDSTFFPYIGLSVGPNVYIERSTTTVAGIAQSTSSTSVLFQALLRPGFYTGLSRTIGLQVEGKLGILLLEFIFLPQVSAAFTL